MTLTPKNYSLLIYPLVAVAFFLIIFFMFISGSSADCPDPDCSISDSFQGEVCGETVFSCVWACGGPSCCAGGLSTTYTLYDTTYTGFCPDDSACGYTQCVITDITYGSCECVVEGSPTPTPSGSVTPTPSSSPSPSPSPSPTLFVNLTAAPSSGTSSIDSVLAADVSGTAIGPITYNFWWNCTYTGNNVSTASTTCGSLTMPSFGTCSETVGVGYKCNNVNTDPKSIPAHTYTSSSTAKVIVQRGTVAPNAEDRVSITITPPTLSVVFSANPASGTSPLSSVLSADVAGTAAGTINYSFWWNCTNTSTSVSTVTTACGTLPAPAAGSCSSNSVGYKCNAVNTDPKSTSAHIYTSNSTAKVIVERSTATPVEARQAITITNGVPTVPTVTITQPDYCTSGPSAFVNWTYSDPDGNPQSAYQVQVDDTGSAWSPPLMLDTGKVVGSGTSYYTGNGVPPWAWQTTYKARVKVWDSLDAESAWKDSGSWTTPKHAYPLVNFTWVPFLNPSANQPIQFTDQTTFYDGGGVGQRGWSWLFGDGGSSTLQNPIHTYVTNGSYDVTDTVTDKDGYTCALTKPIGIERPIPVWKEVSPK